MIPYTIINKKGQAKKTISGLYDLFYYNNQKEQAIISSQKYFHSYDTFYYNK